MQAGGLFAGLGPDLGGIDAGRPAVPEDDLAADGDLERPDARREGDVPRIHRVVRPGHAVLARLGDQVPAGAEPAPRRVRAAGDVDGALQDVGQPERLEDVAADPVRAERDRVREAGRVGVADRVVEVGHRVVEDRAAQVVVGRQVDAVRQQPVVAGQARQAARRVGVADPLADVDVDADAEVGGQPGRGRERFVRAGEGRVDPDQAPAAGPDEPLVLGQAASGAVRDRDGR